MTEIPERTPRYDSVTLLFVENTLPLSSLEQVTTDLNNDFFSVQVTRRIAGPMAGGLYGDPALMFILGAAAASFLNEFGKEAYRALKKGLFLLYTRVKTWANSRTYIPFVVVLKDEQADRAIHFVFPEKLSEDEFIQALGAINPEMIGHGLHWISVFEYREGKGWEEQTQL